MLILEFLSQPLWQRLGLTLVHFLWQGLAVAVLVGAFVTVFRLKHGNARYVAYLLAFTAMIVCPIVTFTAIDLGISPNTELVAEIQSVEVVDSSSYTVLSAGDILTEAGTPDPAMPALADSIPLGQRISGWLNVSMPWALAIWIVGVIVLSVRLIMGLVGVYRWRHHLEPLPETLAQRVASLSEGLGMRGFSRVFISPNVLQAMAVGYLRPMVLLPAAMVTQMQPEMLEAVIAHELAHIRRLDLWVNLAQRVTETLLFYHPAVWWLSNCLRSERELCCDELAVKTTGQRLTYATTLESVSRSRFTAKQPVLAAGLGEDNKPTLSRVRHILGLCPTQRNCPFWLAGVIAVLFLAALVIPTTMALTNKSDENSMDLESVVVEGIVANREKFECGILAWNSKQFNDRDYKGRPAAELAGQYELWWDGKKMATKYLKDQVCLDSQDLEGPYWIEKQQGGNSYDGGVLSRNPDFREDNWLGPIITRWRGLGSQDWLIRQNSKAENISKDWSVVEDNGVKLIKLTTRNMNETSRDYGAYSVSDYDPSKGYGLINEEWYNPDSSPRGKRTVRMLEVIPGGWFPVEVDSKGFAMTDGRLYIHLHYALDIERCSFNDRAALPDRIFKSAEDEQIKHQEKLQKYLAMELEGLSDVKEAAKADKVKLGAQEAIDNFVGLALEDDLEKAAEFAHPDKLHASHIADLTEIAKGQNLWIMAVIADDSSAMAVSSVIRGDHERTGPLVFFLDRVPQDGRDNWLVHDIDMETPDGAEEELKRFLEKHPKAQKVPYDNKPNAQAENERAYGVDGHVEIRLPKKIEVETGPDHKTTDKIEVHSRVLLIAADNEIFKVFFAEENIAFDLHKDDSNYTSELNARQVDRLLRTTQAHSGSIVYTMPTVTVLDGEEMIMSATKDVAYRYTETNPVSGQPEEKIGKVSTGIIGHITPTLPDDENIMLDVELEYRYLLGYKDEVPETEIAAITSRSSISKGQTLLVGGQKITVDKDGRKVPKVLLCLFNAEVQKSPPPPAAEDEKRITIDFMIAEPFVDRRLDWETYTIIQNHMVETATPGEQPGTVGSVLAEYAPDGGDKFEYLVDMLISRGYLKILLNPTLEVYAGHSAKVTIKDQGQASGMNPETLSGEAEDAAQKPSLSGTLSVKPQIRKDNETIQMYIDLDLSTPEKEIKIATMHTVLNKKCSLLPLDEPIAPAEQGPSAESILVMVKATISESTLDTMKNPDVQVEKENRQKNQGL